MNIVEVTGGKPYQRKYVESIAFFCIDKLMPKMESLDINIKLRTIPEDSYGYCMSETTREFDIEIDKNLTLRKLLTTVAHEIVHVKQYARKELTGDSTWQGKTYNPKTTDYWDEPWEIEAHGRECGLFIRWAEKMKLAEKKWTQE
tara:strand:+ start:6062 stop:6496 length:435 start_codon:yes stop_codon:yes gene_type:complete